METIHQAVRTEFHYPVHFTRRAFNAGNTVLREVIVAGGGSRRVIFIVDEGVCTSRHYFLQEIEGYCRAHCDVITSVAPPIVVPGGETVKNDSRYLDSVRSAINTCGICRHSFVIVVGGGATLDMAGYAAATSHRGVRLIRVPSTVLAQNDSGLGVKTSVNRFNKKNFLGTFTPPFAVINDFELLESLSDRDWRSGTAEAVKVALIKDTEFFESIEEYATALAHRDGLAMERLIYRCAQLHLQHISGDDPFETGSSRPLDFGHWAAHKLEQLTNYALRHGEAVAIGIALDVTYTYLAGMLSKAPWERILHVLLDLGLPVYAPELQTRDLLAGLTEFREHLGGELTIILLRDIGKPIEVHDIQTEKMKESVLALSQYQHAPVCSL
jgi:3-dehydroquinate synthase